MVRRDEVKMQFSNGLARAGDYGAFSLWIGLLRASRARASICSFDSREHVFLYDELDNLLIW